MPQVSVIIPTYGRPHLLPRAVGSALADMVQGSVEVLVIPNGGDESWRESLAQWRDDPNVHVYPVAEANQNIARNYGLYVAKGELVRFLDDDDYLIPQASAAQYRMMTEQQLDICSGDAEIRNQDNSWLSRLSQPSTQDFTFAVLQRARLQLPFTHVYRRDTLGSVQWPSDILRSEDIVFLIRYAIAAPRKWGRLSQPVGVWYQHRAPRMSFDRPFSIANEITATELHKAYECLSREGRLTSNLSEVIAEAIWECVHRSFYLRPFYWTRVAREAMKIAPQSMAINKVFGIDVSLRFSPLLLQWLALPTRIARHLYRYVRSLFCGWDYKRTL